MKYFAENEKDSLIRKYCDGNIEKIDLPVILKAAENGDKSAQDLLKQQADLVGIAIANVINIIDPELIVIGGEVGINLGDYLLQYIKKSIKNHTSYFPNVEVSLSSLGMIAVPIGAAAFLINSSSVYQENI
jgi:glucokinase